jgi:hypothetical protein
MVTGKMWRFAGIKQVLLQPASEIPCPPRRTWDPRFAFDLGWRLAGGSPQQAVTSDLSRMVSPGPNRNTDRKLAPVNLPGALNEERAHKIQS